MIGLPRSRVSACAAALLVAACNFGGGAEAGEGENAPPPAAETAHAEDKFPPAPIPAAVGRMISNLERARPKRIIWVSANAAPGGNGSKARPFASISQGVAAASACTAVMVEAGEYREHIRFSRDQDGTPACPIWLVSADGVGKARVVAPDNNVDAIGGGGVQYVVVEGFAVYGGRNGIHFGMNGGDYTDLASHVVVRFNRVEAPAMDAIKVNGAEVVYIADNVLIGAPNEGIDYVAVVQSAIERNTIRDMETTSAAIILKGGSSNILVASNLVSGISANGIAVGGWVSRNMTYRNGYAAAEAERVTVTGNRVEHIGKSALVFMGAHDARAYDNSLEGGSGHPVVWVGGNRPDAQTKFRSERVRITGNRVFGSRRPLETRPEADAINAFDNDRSSWSGTVGASEDGYVLPAG